MSEQAERLFEQARVLPREARAAFLSEACHGDAALRDELLSLLVEADAAEEFFGLLGDAVGSGTFYTGTDTDATGGPAEEAPSLPELLPGHVIRHYQILERVGAGGMGTVYRARDTRLGRDVALKFLPSFLKSGDEAERRLLNEARAVAALEHPNVCTVHEIGETDEGRPFIAMAFYSGQTLKDRLRQGALPPTKAAEVTRELASGLAAAHARGIIHGDVKPGNVMLTADETVKLLDFGIAQVADPTQNRPGVARGTLPYMSPQQIRGQPLEPRADLWSLGVVLYEMLTGVHPFRSPDERDMLQAIVHGDPEAVTKLRPETPAWLARIVERLLRKDPAVRYQSAGELHDDLVQGLRSHNVVHGLVVAARRRPILAVVGAVVTPVAVALWLVGRGDEPQPTSVNRDNESSIAAYELYLKGSDETLLRSDSGVRLGIRYFEEAIALDSNYAAAHAGLALMYFVLSVREETETPVENLLGLASETALKAVALDDSVADAHAVLGLVRLYAHYDFAAAEAELTRAIELDATRARYPQWLAQLYLQMGRPREALPVARRALEIDSRSASAHAEVAHALLANGRYDEALAKLRDIANLQPPLLRAAPYAAQAYAMKRQWADAIEVLRPNVESGQSLALYGYVLARAGQRNEALRIRQTLLDRWQSGKSRAFDVVVVHAGLGDLDEAFVWLEKAADDRSVFRPNFHIMEPIFEDLRRDPRFEPVRERLGLALP